MKYNLYNNLCSAKPLKAWMFKDILYTHVNFTQSIANDTFYLKQNKFLTKSRRGVGI